MLVVIGLVVCIGGTVLGKLTGDHVCQEEQRHKVNVTEFFVRNSTVRNYEWCLNVPPRCSFYTTRLLNESKIVEKEITDLIDKCCPGYVQNGDICTPSCPDCQNGRCDNGRCRCFPGFKGETCATSCLRTEWGEDCKFNCSCDHGVCEPTNGKCVCDAGWSGSRCQSLCPLGFWGPNCHEQCMCNPDESCDPITGQCDQLSTTSTPTTVLINTIQLKNNGKFETDQNGLLSTTILTTSIVDNIMSDSNRRFLLTTNRPKLSNDDMVDEERDNFVNSASAATAISLGVILVAAVIVVVNHFRTKGGKKEVSTVAVYTHSIFHTPLPEPPTFENPIFAAPEAAPEGQRFEAHVVCSMNFPTHSSKGDPREYLYDHPPSTGSYRAASIPEPPENEPPSPIFEPVYDEIPSGMLPTPISEPPPSYKAASLYMNTCGKTRF
ncbi:uncharacterized protein NimA [Tribolium castaneum]|uniref:Nimrod A n=1 Tax=Tribolium castaneum TaxID=7070 RepID=D6X4K8_TRICA|nr:nimrod A [Tribolium castaneum]